MNPRRSACVRNAFREINSTAAIASAVVFVAGQKRAVVRPAGAYCHSDRPSNLRPRHPHFDAVPDGVFEPDDEATGLRSLSGGRFDHMVFNDDIPDDHRTIVDG